MGCTRPAPAPSTRPWRNWRRRAWQADTDAGRKRYAITADGLGLVQAQRAQLDAAVQRTHHRARALVRANVPTPVRDALRRIKHALLVRHDCWSEAEIERVARLLAQTADGMAQAGDD